jgi:hypothetical protein
MRRLLLPLLLAGVAVAADELAPRLQAFEEARKHTLEPGGQATVYPAFEALVAVGDVRAVAPIASYILETIQSDRRLLDDGRKVQAEMAEASARVEVLKHELEQLDLKEKAGDRTVGPEIEKRVSEQMTLQRKRDQLEKNLDQIDRTLLFLRELRGRLADGCVALLKGKKGEQAAVGISGVRHALDVADKDEAFVLVRIFGDSDLDEAEDQLLEILAAPKADPAVRMRTQYALVHHLSRRGAEALLRIWEEDPDGAGAHAQHVLSLVAKKRLGTLDEARAWIATLP